MIDIITAQYNVCVFKNRYTKTTEHYYHVLCFITDSILLSLLFSKSRYAGTSLRIIIHRIYYYYLQPLRINTI